MDNLPSRTWFSRLIGALCRAGRTCRRLWRAIRADGRQRYIQIGAVLLVAFLLSLQVMGPDPASVSRDLGPTFSPLPTSTPPAGSPTPGAWPSRALRGVRDGYAATVGKVVTRQPTPTQQLASPLPAPSATPTLPDSSVVLYVVQEGDSLQGIADRFGLQRETVVWSNRALLVDPGRLYVGQELYILPIDGVYYTVQRGDTLDAIAARFQVSVGAIAGSEYNAPLVRAGQVAPGQRLIVPGGSQPFRAQPVRVVSTPAESETSPATGRWVWPVGGYISQGYWDLHRAIDIAGDHGSTVVSSDGGTVTYASWNVSGYGNLVIIDHGNGFVSYYAHLYGFYVDVGDRVAQGQPLGALGNTGLSTGPHLHFEIRDNGELCDPIDLLPQE